ncbi:MAG: CBS domain-containing protein [Candidatus Nanopelagicales bacterium]
MSVKHLLRFKGDFVATIAPEATLTELVDKLAEFRIGAMVVSRDGNAIDGIVSERDIARALTSRNLQALWANHRMDLDAVTVSQIMTSDVRTCSPDDTVHELMEAMTAGRMRHLPVVDAEGQMIGLVSIGDIVKARISDLETERTALVEYVTSGR